MPENELKKILSEIEVRLKVTHQYLGFLLVKIKLHSFFILNFMYVLSSPRLWNNKEPIWVIGIFFFNSSKPSQSVDCLVVQYGKLMLFEDSVLRQQETCGRQQMSLFWDLLAFYGLCHSRKLLGHRNWYHVPREPFCLPHLCSYLSLYSPHMTWPTNSICLSLASHSTQKWSRLSQCWISLPRESCAMFSTPKVMWNTGNMGRNKQEGHLHPSCDYLVAG